MSLYHELGGGEALQAALERFYQRVMADPPVASYFDGLDVERIKAKQKAFWTVALGGEGAYDGDVGAVHAGARGKGLDGTVFDRFVGHFRATLEEFGVPEEKIREVLAVTEEHRASVLEPSRRRAP